MTGHSLPDLQGDQWRTDRNQMCSHCAGILGQVDQNLSRRNRCVHLVRSGSVRTVSCWVHGTAEQLQ